MDDSNQRLTFFLWTEWAQSAVTSVSDLQREFEMIAQSEFLLENFFNLPKTVQSRISTYAREKSSILLDYAVSLDLRNRMYAIDLQEFNSYTYDWLAAPSRASTQIARQYIRRNGDILRENVGYFIYHQSSWHAKSQHANLVSDLTTLSVYLLAVLHGAVVVHEVIDSWMNMSEYHSLPDFVALVDNWEKVKNYPTDWAIQLATSMS